MNKIKELQARVKELHEQIAEYSEQVTGARLKKSQTENAAIVHRQKIDAAAEAYRQTVGRIEKGERHLSGELPGLRKVYDDLKFALTSVQKAADDAAIKLQELEREHLQASGANALQQAKRDLAFELYQDAKTRRGAALVAELNELYGYFHEARPERNFAQFLTDLGVKA